MTTNPQPIRNLKLEASNLIDFLVMPEATEKLCSTVAMAERLLLKITMGNESREAQERLEKLIDRVNSKLTKES